MHSQLQMKYVSFAEVPSAKFPSVGLQRTHQQQ
jgi:hypothetical protein